MQMYDIISQINENIFNTIIIYISNSSYKRLWKVNHINDLFSDYDEYYKYCKEVYKIIKKNKVNCKKISKKDFLLLLDNVKEVEDSIDDLLHHKEYYYNETLDEYIIYLQSKPKPMILKGTFWRSIVSAYSNWDKQPSTINQMCRKFSMSRRTMVELLRVMGVTHDSSPYTDEVLSKAKEEDLVTDLLRRKEERVLLQAEQKEYRAVQKDAQKFRKYKHFVSMIKTVLEDIEIDISDIDFEQKYDNFSILLSPTDFHWGKYASPLTGDEYNRDIAKERLFAHTKDILDRVKKRGNPEKIIVAIGGDGLHIDNQQKTTTRGTRQDCDGTAIEIASSYVRLCIEYINMIRQYGNVEVFIVSGNHDYYTSAIIREAIWAYFNRVDFVTINEEITTRHTFLYGKSLITIMHGDNGSVKDFPAIIAGENAEIWGKSKQRFIFTGHLHTERELPTFGNITVYRMPSLAGTDDWHWQKGYKSRKALIGYILDNEKGVIATEISPC